MNFTKMKALGISCAYFLFVVFSASANAFEIEGVETGVSIEGWSHEGGENLPILDFEGARVPEEMLSDIRVENVTVDDDGSTRFQLTHRGPISRQVFAHVRRVQQDDGFTRSIITNVADGQQIEYLNRTSLDLAIGKPGNKSVGNTSIQKLADGGQGVECPLCWWGTIIISESMCAATTWMAYELCQDSCRYRGGMVDFSSGICGVYNAECTCMYEPKRINEEF